jgi:hypothetical protein
VVRFDNINIELPKVTLVITEKAKRPQQISSGTPNSFDDLVRYSVMHDHELICVAWVRVRPKLLTQNGRTMQNGSSTDQVGRSRSIRNRLCHQANQLLVINV